MIKKKSNGRYLVDMRDAKGDRFTVTVDSKREADQIEAITKSEKYFIKQVKHGLKEAKHSFQQAVQEYKNSKYYLRSKSLQSYFMVIDTFAEFIKRNNINFLHEITSAIMDNYYFQLISPRKDPRRKSAELVRRTATTINFHLGVLREFFDIQFVKGNIKKNPMSHIRNLKVITKPPEYYRENEIDALFSQQMDESYRAVFRGLLHSGMRIMELAHLEWSDIDLDKHLIRIEEKENFKPKTKNSNRVIPMNEELFNVISNLNKKRRNKRYVFTSPKGCQVRERRALDALKKVAEQAEIKSRVFLHKFRHTYATMLVLKDVKLQNIKALLGHSSIKETERYAHNKADHLFDEVNKINYLTRKKLSKVV